MSRRRSSLAELERQLRAVEWGGTNLGLHLTECGDELAPLLGVDASELHMFEALPDQDIAVRLHAMLARRAEANAMRHKVVVRKLALAAARQLAATAVWTKSGVALDAALVLGDLLLDTSRLHIAFHVPGVFQVSLSRRQLVDITKVMKPYGSDVTIWVDETRFHVRWRRGRGGLDLCSQPIPAHESSHALCVNIPPRPVEAPRPKPFSTETSAPTPRARQGEWFSDFLTALFS